MSFLLQVATKQLLLASPPEWHVSCLCLVELNAVPGMRSNQIADKLEGLSRDSEMLLPNVIAACSFFERKLSAYKP